MLKNVSGVLLKCYGYPIKIQIVNLLKKIMNHMIYYSSNNNYHSKIIN